MSELGCWNGLLFCLCKIIFSTKSLLDLDIPFCTCSCYAIFPPMTGSFAITLPPSQALWMCYQSLTLAVLLLAVIVLRFFLCYTPHQHGLDPRSKIIELCSDGSISMPRQNTEVPVARLALLTFRSSVTTVLHNIRRAGDSVTQNDFLSVHEIITCEMAF